MSNPPARRNTGIVNRSAPTATVVPVLIYEDVAKAIVWLCEAFGFSERLRAARADGRLMVTAAPTTAARQDSSE